MLSQIHAPENPNRADSIGQKYYSCMSTRSLFRGLFRGCFVAVETRLFGKNSLLVSLMYSLVLIR